MENPHCHRPRINGLPHEVLLFIVSYAIFSWEITPKFCRLRSPWLTLRSVCRLWRNIIDGTPAFWTVIVDAHSEDYVALVVSNSSAVFPLSVSAPVHARRKIAPSLFLPNNHISELHLKIADASSLDQIITAPYNLLRIVHLASSSQSHTHISTHLHPSFYNAQSLTLDCVELPISSLIRFNSLRSLVLSYEMDSAVFALPMASFLAMLGAQRQLESLVISVAFISTAQDTAVPRIELPVLTTLHAEFTMPEAAIFLASLRLAHLRRLDIAVGELITDDVIADVVSEEVRDIANIISLSPSVVSTKSHAPAYEDSNTIYLQSEREDSYFRFESEAHSRTLARHLSRVIGTFGGELIRTLELDSYSIPVSGLTPSTDSAESWIRLMALMPNIARIRVFGGGYGVENLPTALASFTPSGLPCPQLSHLLFLEGKFHISQCQAWRDALGRRQACGATLSRLVFSNWAFPPDFDPTYYEELCDFLKFSSTKGTEADLSRMFG